ncbi:SDR family oxidoreductase [Billgrantia ethanolica]|uniref:SDR family oxidoreductase n=1 Tax=Billgrantia ethanolica TaxID=2733486 RepID=A0ABS9A6D8_9GAMM|nr:SDR family oxidoreductase [Halomonas ethanolica]MCE8004102.1 SDR family oxidoreductase [Halomonas ethanolica]
MYSPAMPETVVVVTGASSGIGRATAHEFARQGATLFLAARDRTALHDVAEECHRLGGQARFIVADVTKPEDMQRLAQSAIEAAGRIDVWVNNAGVGALGAFEELPLQDHERVIQTDLIGQINGAYAVLPHFKQRGRGILINNISLGGWAPQPYAASYSAAKFGLRAFAESLQGELRHWPEIHVCNVYPAVMDTPGFRDGGNYTGRAVKPVPPVYDPRRTARTIVKLARYPRPTAYVGLPAILARLAHGMPGYPWLNASLVDFAMRQARPMANSSGNLYAPPSGERRIDGGFRATDTRRKAVVAASLAGILLGFCLSRRRRLHQD